MSEGERQDGGAGVAAAPAVLEMRDITKTFGPVKANDNISLRLRRGEILGLLGENGAGKSTLMKILYRLSTPDPRTGVVARQAAPLRARLGANGAGEPTLMKILYGLYRPDSGTVVVDGEPVQVRDPKDAVSRGIGMVHQHFTLIPPLTVAENIVLGAEPRRGGSLDMARAIRETEELAERYGLNVDPRARAGGAGADPRGGGSLGMARAIRETEELAERYGLKVDPRARVADLSVGVQQRVEILKALYRDARILVLDEPTAVLTPQETEDLFSTLKELVADGPSLVLTTPTPD